MTEYKSEIARVSKINEESAAEINKLKGIIEKQKKENTKQRTNIDSMKQKVDSMELEKSQAVKSSDTSKTAMQIVIGLSIALVFVQVFFSYLKQ